MKTFSVRIIFTVILLAGIFAELIAQVPDWYATHKSIKYPTELYLIGVGSGTGDNAIDKAKKAAQTDLVSQIRVQIQAQIKTVSESFQFRGNEQLYSDFRSSVRTAVSDEIMGMETAETVVDASTGTSYALVILDREKYCENLRNEMDSGWKQVADLRVASTAAATKGVLNDALQSLADARAAIPPLLTKQALFNVVSSTPYKSPVGFGPSNVTTDIRTLLSSIRLTKWGGDNQKGKIGERFAEPFAVQVTLDQEGKPVPVAGGTVVFETADNLEVGMGTTNDQGIVTLSTTVRASTGNGLRALVSFAKLDREFQQNFLASAVYFSWKTEASDVSFALKVKTSSSKSTSSLRNAFSSAITKIGYKVVESSNHIVEVKTESGEPNTVEGIAGTMYSVSATVTASLISKESGNTLGSVSFAGKGLARSEQEAIEKAVGNVKINRNDLADLLEKALQK